MGLVADLTSPPSHVSNVVTPPDSTPEAKENQFGSDHIVSVFW